MTQQQNQIYVGFTGGFSSTYPTPFHPRLSCATRMKPQTRLAPADLVPRLHPLVELTIVLVIVALLLGGLTTAFMVQQDNASNQGNTADTGHHQQALLGFAVANGRLPGTRAIRHQRGWKRRWCASTTACTGFIPWQTLGWPRPTPGKADPLQRDAGVFEHYALR